MKNITPEDSQNIGFTLRTGENKIYVICSHFGGPSQIVRYHDFLNKPYINMVKVRQLDVNSPVPQDLTKKSMEFVQRIRSQKKVYSEEIDQDRMEISQIPNFFERMRHF